MIEKYIQISFMEAMSLINQGQIKVVFFKIGKSLVPARDYKADIDTLKQKKWFRCEEVSNEQIN
ncbi:hypothetical protein BME96_12580 [Virgibacillus halodenitrificans]|uniref:Uncharacterized protein n=1 Tax=Virgibacillus halodenitrificans TaxID=1482 RepID=A0AAC9J068_VIRHA|nr:hypothetical protein [Virgibacillus halodenitrificans]APC48976.1 hypothetical protein BME96_12580 [Virgibacillus halodenitrificans]